MEHGNAELSEDMAGNRTKMMPVVKYIGKAVLGGCQKKREDLVFMLCL